MRIDPSNNMTGCNVACIMGEYEGNPCNFGEVYLYDDGTASVYDDFWGDPTRYFEGEGAHHSAMVAIVTRIVQDCTLVW